MFFNILATLRGVRGRPLRMRTREGMVIDRANGGQGRSDYDS